MLSIRRLILLSHWRKNILFGLVLILIAIWSTTGFLGSISLGEGALVNTAFQYISTELIGLLFLLYFGSTLLPNYQRDKIIQLLRSKKKTPRELYIGSWLGIFTIYMIFGSISALVTAMIADGTHTLAIIINRALIGSIALSRVMGLSLVTNPYLALIASLVMIGLSYSFNFLIFSIPTTGEGTLSYHIMTSIQYLFPKFDLLYSHLGSPQRGWTVLAHLLYSTAISSLVLMIFLARSDTK